MTLYKNSKVVTNKINSTGNVLFFKVYTKKEYHEELERSDASFYSYDEHLDFPYKVKQKNGTDTEDGQYFFIEVFPSFVFGKGATAKSFIGFATDNYMIEEICLNNTTDGLRLETKEHMAVGLLIGKEVYVCFMSDIELL